MGTAMPGDACLLGLWRERKAGRVAPMVTSVECAVAPRRSGPAVLTP